MDASVNERLGVIADAVRAIDPAFASAVDDLIDRLKSSGAGSAAPQVGDPMPAFILPDQSGALVNLEQVLSQGPAAVSFHRGSWCPYCRLNTIALAEANKEAQGIGAQLVAITPDLQKFTNALKSEAAAQFPILTDVDNGYAMSLNLAIWVGSEVYRITSRVMQGDIRFIGDETSMLPIPATFVVGTDGLIKARYIDPDYRQRMEINDLLGALRAAT